MKNDFSKQFLPILEKANNLAGELGSPAIRPEHLVLAALRNRDGYAFKILSQLNVPIDKMIDELTDYIQTSKSDEETTTLFEQQFKICLSAIRHLQLATSEARKMGVQVIAGEHVILALMHDARNMDSDFLGNLKSEYLNFDISIQNIGQSKSSPTDNSDNNDNDDDDEMSEFESMGSGSKSSKSRQTDKVKSGTPALDKYGYDMTKAAAEGRL
ncbi:MAG: hypothetical protein K2H86_02175, partial [Muribaculaceae bacterium]|nr:hypothetical protein [Muribaculaceae bacterium]